MTATDAPLGFNNRWFELGVVDDAHISKMCAEWARGKDQNSEHYRYGAFCKFLSSHRPLDPSLALALYDLGDGDPDHAMGGAIMKEIVVLPECPIEVWEKAKNSGREWLVKVIRRRELLKEIRGDYRSECFERYMREGDEVVQRLLVELECLSRDQVEQLATDGINRAIRNLANVRLRVGRYASE